MLADDAIHSQDSTAFSDVLQLPPPEDAEDAWRVLSKYLRQHPVDGIIAQSEPALLLGALAAREFGMVGPSVESAVATVNKFDTRTRLAAAGIAQPAFELVQNAHAVRRFARQHGWPVVIKATASSRQRLVTKVSCESDLDSAVAELKEGLSSARDVLRLASFAQLEGMDLGFDPLDQFLVESFQVGEALECDGLIANPTRHWFGVCEQLACDRPGFVIEGYLLPGRISAEQERQTLHMANAAVATLGLTNTGVSVEMRLAPNGPHLIEVNGRLPWDDGLNDLIQASTGCNPGALMLRLATGKALPRIRIRQHGALIYQCNFDEGQVTSVPDSAQRKALTSRHLTPLIFAKQGDRLLAAGHPNSRPHVAGMLATDPQSTQTALDLGRAGLGDLPLGIRAAEPPRTPIPAKNCGPHQAATSG